MSELLVEGKGKGKSSQRQSWCIIVKLITRYNVKKNEKVLIS